MFSPIKQIIISPPFGTHVKYDWATSVHGTFTAYPRPGSRIWKAVKTLRPISGGWVNRIGLLNEGIENADLFDPNLIYSMTAIDSREEWNILYENIPSNRIVELNLGCPNAPHVLPSTLILRKFRMKCKLVIVKIPPIQAKAEKAMEICHNAGISHIHACNTIPTERGGESGNRLREYSKQIIKWLQNNYPTTTIIAGGGIYRPEHVWEYQELGVNRFSLSTAFFTPWHIQSIRHSIESMS